MSFTVSVFCGSSDKVPDVYKDAAESVVQALAAQDCSIVYGGGRTGLMGVVARSALAKGMKVTGIIPEVLVERELLTSDVMETIFVRNMHERKALMADRSQAFIALPGGPGTFEEIIEQWVWAIIGIHHKPCALLNVNGYFSPFEDMIDKMVSEGFVSEKNTNALFLSDDPKEIMRHFSKVLV